MTANALRIKATEKLIEQVESIMADSDAIDGFNAAQWVAQWMDRPLPALADRKPVEYLDTAEGQKLLAQLIAMMQTGTYA
jgi:uncharacterized protein (DUF2384 family)